MFVRDKDKLPKIGASRLNKFLISNWSNGLAVFTKNFITKKKRLGKYLFKNYNLKDEKKHRNN